MQLQIIPSIDGAPQHFLAVVQFYYNGVFYKGSLIYELMYGGEHTGSYLVQLSSESGSYTFKMPVHEPEHYLPQDEEESRVDSLLEEVLQDDEADFELQGSSTQLFSLKEIIPLIRKAIHDWQAEEIRKAIS